MTTIHADAMDASFQEDDITGARLTDEGAGHSSEPETGVRVRKCRRARRRSSVPYYQLTEEEQQRREERERRRVERLMVSMRARGRIMAPYNTTEFLIGDHETEMDVVKMLDNDRDCCSGASWSDEEDFMIREFNKLYDQQHYDNLTQMSKDTLMVAYQSVMEKNQKLEEKLSYYEEEEEKIKAIMKEKSILQAQNLKLKRSNSSMQARIRKLSETTADDMSSQSNSK